VVVYDEKDRIRHREVSIRVHDQLLSIIGRDRTLNEI
jgi:hypothetical protein